MNNEYRITNQEAGSWKPEAGSQAQSGPAVYNRGLYKVSVRMDSIPGGLYVYRRTGYPGNSTPNGVVQFNSSGYFYTHLIPLESGSWNPKSETQNRVFATCNLLSRSGNPDPSGEPETRQENIEYRLTNVESGSQETEVGIPIAIGRKLEEEKSCFLTCNSNFPAPLSPFIEGDESRFIGAGGTKDNTSGTPGKENIEYRILNIEHQITNQEVGCRKPEARGISETQNLQPATCNLQPVTTNSKYKDAPFLPRGRFNSGDYPGAAAITILSIPISSPRVSPMGNQDAEFSTPHWVKCGVENSTSRSACKGLPVINQKASHQGSIVPLVSPVGIPSEGDEIRFSESGGKWDKSRFIGTGGIDDKIPNSRVQEVSTTSPKIRMKGFLKERRYACDIS